MLNFLQAYHEAIHNVLHLSHTWGAAGINQGKKINLQQGNNKPQLKCED